MKLCSKCKLLKAKSFFHSKGTHPYCKECYSVWRKNRYKKNKLDALSHYSGGKLNCSCCGENRYEFLSIEHMKGGGHKHRLSIKTDIYYWLKKNNWPSGYEVLCFNCNLSKGFNGYCPHQFATSKNLLEEIKNEQ